MNYKPPWANSRSKNPASCPTLTPCVQCLNYTLVAMAAITEDTLGGGRPLLYFFIISKYKNLRGNFHMGLSVGNDMVTWIWHCSHILTGRARGRRPAPCFCFLFVFFNFSLRMAADGDCAPVRDALKRRVSSRFLFARRRNERSAE